MSHALISRNPDLRRLRDEGYSLEVRKAHLLVHDVPYLDASRQVRRGTLVSSLNMVGGDRTARPDTHVAYFIGSHPYRHAGGEITAIKHGSGRQVLAEGIEIDHAFSNKPPEGYPDYFAKMTRYIEIISVEARAVEHAATAKTGRLIEEADPNSVFLYTDTASSRAGITALVELLGPQRIAIVGAGGSGAYVLDLVAKTPVKEIHLFDGDEFWQHNAFRAPGAAGADAWKDDAPLKVAYFAEMYAKMRRGIVRHPYRVDENNVNELTQFDYVFICVDKGCVRAMIIAALSNAGRRFIDCGIGVEMNDARTQLRATCRVTAGVPGRYDHIKSRVPTDDLLDEEALYASNIQVVELNAASAVMAVILWKKLSGFYVDERGELHSQLTVPFNSLHSAGEPRDREEGEKD